MLCYKVILTTTDQLAYITLLGWAELGCAGLGFFFLTDSGEVTQMGDQWLSLSARLFAQLAEH